MRIIAGTHRGRPIRAPRGMETRPTTDRVREALFSIIGDLQGDIVLDCYAGSGALGLEALSRGAANVTFIESGRRACEVISRNLEGLGFAERATVLHRAVERAGPALGGQRFDVVLSDAPWPICQSAAHALLNLVARRVSPGATIVLGHPTRQVLELPLPAGFARQQTRNWGDSAMTFVRYEEPTA